MGVDTKIQWCHHSWSPWHGCAVKSEGCANCYAWAGSKRNPDVLGIWGPNGTRVVSKSWDKPLAWNRGAFKRGERKRVFPSLCDWLEERDDLIEPRVRFLRLIHDTSKGLDWLLLTKRPENFARLMRQALDHWPTGINGRKRDQAYEWASDWLHGRSAPENVWFGVSTENQARADERIPILLDIPAKVRFLSVEPLLGPIDLTRIAPAFPGAGKDCLRGWHTYSSSGHFKRCGKIDWVVTGGESGPKARPCNVTWIRSIVGQCKTAGVPVFVKQLGSEPRPSHLPSDVRVRFVRDPKGGDPEEWPEDLRVRQFPEPVEAS